MSKRDLQEGWGLFGDLFRETNWPVRIGLVLGPGIAVVFWVRLIIVSGGFALEGIPAEISLTLVAGSGLGLLLAGGLAGVLLGSLLEAALGSPVKGGEREEDEDDRPRQGPRRRDRRYED